MDSQDDLCQNIMKIYLHLLKLYPLFFLDTVYICVSTDVFELL